MHCCTVVIVVDCLQWLCNLIANGNRRNGKRRSGKRRRGKRRYGKRRSGKRLRGKRPRGPQPMQWQRVEILLLYKSRFKPPKCQLLFDVETSWYVIKSALLLHCQPFDIQSVSLLSFFFHPCRFLANLGVGHSPSDISPPGHPPGVSRQTPFRTSAPGQRHCRPCAPGHMPPWTSALPDKCSPSPGWLAISHICALTSLS